MPAHVFAPDIEVSNALAIDPEIQQFRRQVAANYARHPALDTVTMAEARRICEAVRAPFAQGGPEMARQIDHEPTAAGRPTRVRLHVPAGARAPMPVLIYLHGGGWHLFSLDTHDRLMREYADRAGIAVLGVDYALAPEARYPVALNQVVEVFHWLAAGAGGFGLDGHRIALGGDSAGANLALAAAMKLRAGAPGPSVAARTADPVPVPTPRALVLNYGAFFRETGSESHRLYSGPDYSLTSDEMRGFWRGYLGDHADAAGGDPFAEPLRAPIRSLCGLPPTQLTIAQCDVLRDDSVGMAARLAAAGVDVSPVLYDGATHSFLEAMATADISRRALDTTARWLRHHLGLID